MKTVKRRAPKHTRAPAKPGFQFTTPEIDAALAAGTHTEELKAYFGPGRFPELRQMRPAARRGNRRGPRVLVLPGIMGSTLGSTGRIFDHVIWLNPFNIALGEALQLALTPDGAGRHGSLDAIPYYYYFLRQTLKAEGFDVAYHHYDWRKGFAALGAELAAKILADPAGEVNLVAHSMGGLVVRAALKANPAAAARVKRFIMLGTPNHGSFNIVQVLTGGYDICRRVDQMDPRHSLAELTEQVFFTFPGMYQMLPFEATFGNADVFDAGKYPGTFARPRADQLAAARQVPAVFADPSPNWYLVAGKGVDTIIGATFEPNRVTFETAKTGDGAVPLRSAALPGVKTRLVDAEHADLPNADAVRAHVIDLLHTEPAEWAGVEPPTDRGRATGRFTDADLRTAPVQVTTPPAKRTAPSAAIAFRDLAAGVFAPPPAPPAPIGEPGAAPTPSGDDLSLRGLAVSFRRRRRLDLKLVRGSVWDLDVPAGVVGVFRNVRPEGATTALDQQMAGAVGDLIARRMFGADPGQVFILPTPGHRVGPNLAVFVGLGEFDRFTDESHRFAAANTVRMLARCRVDEFATILFGSNAGRGVPGAVENLVRGFLDGLEDADPAFRFRRIVICEVDQQRYDEARRTVRRLATSGFFGDVDVAFDEEDLTPPPVPADVRAASPPAAGPIAYLYARGTPTGDKLQLDLSLLAPAGGTALQGRPRDVATAQLGALLKTIDSSSFDVAKFGKALTDLVLPAEIAAALADPAVKDSHLTVVHDREAARLPWETIRLGNHIPARGAGLSRRYVTDLPVAKWLLRRREDVRLNVLLVANPLDDLKGADKEAEAIRKLFDGRETVRTTSVTKGDATRERLLGLFGSGDYDVIHYAGHAAFDADDPGNSGVVCANEERLTGRDLAALPALPALFFANACESGRVRKAGDAATRIQRTVSFAEAFLVNGISQFIGTYWPVGDNSAETFATTFYSAVVEKRSIGDALVGARTAVAKLSENARDWADYMHYGDPRFALKVDRRG